MNRETLFYTHSNDIYGHFVIPFIYFVLMASESYSVEVWATDCERHESKIARLNKMFGDRALLVPTTSRRPSESRFRFPPATHKPFTYISDIDIITLDPLVAEWHISNLDDRCFSNAIREREPHEKYPRLTGLMFVLTDEWYLSTEAARKARYPALSDEMVLAQIAFTAFPETEAQLKAKKWARPVHGIHISPAREPVGDNGVGWEITSRWKHSLKRIQKHETWTEFWKMTDDKWKQQYKRIGTI